MSKPYRSPDSCAQMPDLTCTWSLCAGLSHRFSRASLAIRVSTLEHRILQLRRRQLLLALKGVSLPASSLFGKRHGFDEAPWGVLIALRASSRRSHSTQHHLTNSQTIQLSTRPAARHERRYQRAAACYSSRDCSESLHVHVDSLWAAIPP